MKVRVFDELWKGTEQVPNWLGQPVGDAAVHLAAQTPDLLEGRGESWPDAFIGRFQGAGITFSREGTEVDPIMAIRSTSSARSLTFTLPGTDLTAADLLVTLRLRAQPLEGFPDTVPRRVEVWEIPAGEGISTANKEFTWAGADPFEASFYFQNVGRGPVHLRFVVEGRQQVYFEEMKAYSATDGRYREYDGGVVFANPSTRSYTFKVGELFPGVGLRRLQGAANQDPRTNNGDPVGQELTISPKDALFVVRSES